MGPKKKAKKSRKRTHSPVPDTAAKPSSIEFRTAAGDISMRISRSDSSDEDYDEDYNEDYDEDDPYTPSLDEIMEEPQENRAKSSTEIEDPTDEERIDWYLDVAKKKLKRVQWKANEDDVTLGDLWELLIFGQHMYAGMKEEYGIDLNKALVEKATRNAAKGLTPLEQPDNFPYGIPAPRRCQSCSRVIVEDLNPLSSRRPWNRGRFPRLARHRDKSGPTRTQTFSFGPGATAGTRPFGPVNLPLSRLGHFLTIT